MNINEQKMIRFLVNYEVNNSWLAGWITNPWLQKLAAKYYASKVRRKLRCMKNGLALREIIARDGSLENALNEERNP
jgi:hypothetical protein